MGGTGEDHHVGGHDLEFLRHYPWLLSPAACISPAVLAFNCSGDGLRDAADPYSV